MRAGEVSGHTASTPLLSSNFPSAAARLALVDGSLGLAVVLGCALRVVIRVTVEGERIVGIESIADPAILAAFEVEYL